MILYMFIIHIFNNLKTFIGTILISVNPNKLLPLFSVSVAQRYQQTGEFGIRNLAPHIFSIAHSALVNRRRNNEDQTIVIR